MRTLVCIRRLRDVAAMEVVHIRSAAKSTTALKLVDSELDTPKGVATLTMKNLPVNSLSLEMCQTLSSAIKEAEAVPDIKCLILQSSSPSVFSAGLDLAEMLKPEPDRLTRFWRSFQDLYLDLYGSRLACVAAIEGHAMAGGCMLALSCDYRIMASATDKERPINIGLNETKLGIAAPPWLAQQMIDTVGRRCAEKSLQLGQIYSSEDALKIGLIDEVVSKENVRNRALEIALTLSNIPERARVASKMLIRKDRIDTMAASRQQDTDDFVGFVTDVSIQNNLAAYFQMLAAKRKKE